MVFSSRLDSVAAVLAVKGALRRAQKPRALDRSGPLQTHASLREEKQKQKILLPSPAWRFVVFAAMLPFSTKILRQETLATTIANSADP